MWYLTGFLVDEAPVQFPKNTIILISILAASRIFEILLQNVLLFSE